MSQHFLNKQEKEKRIIELHLQNKTIREIAKEVHMAFSPISKIIKAFERKAKRKVRNQSSLPKKPSLSTQSFILYKEGKQIDDVKILLDIPFNLASRYWKQYQKSIGMFESYEFYRDYQYDIPTLLSINNFMKKNNVYGNNVLNILRDVKDLSTLQLSRSILKYEIAELDKNKNLQQFYQNNRYYLP